MSQNVMSREAYAQLLYSKSTGSYQNTYIFHDDYNDHQTLAMSGCCIAAECNTTSDVGYCLQSFPKDET